MRTQPENVYIRTLRTTTGNRVTTGVAHVYNDAERAVKIEPKYIITRNKGKEVVQENTSEKKEEAK
jgi:ribosomal protein S24E